MNIVGFHFTKISAERKRTAVGQININNNVSIKDITEAKIGVGDRGAIRVSFLFSSKYGADFAALTLEGDIVLLADASKTKSIIDDWAKSKKLDQQLAQVAMSALLDRCNIQALLIARDLGLPSPVPLPKVNFQQTGKTASKEPVTTTKVDAKKKK